VLPGHSAPICCVKPVSHRPLTPLTRALQLECGVAPVQYLKTGFDVLIAECLESRDPLRRLAMRGWTMVRDTVAQLPNSTCRIEDVRSVEGLNALLNQHSYDVLILSGHGFYDRARNAAGLIVGGRPTLGEDIERVPPLVVLSACHVAPRGVGAVTISDLLLARGATAVLGTLIPVDVTRNALLMVRLFTYVHEAITEPGRARSFDELWEWITTSNAVNEVLDAGPRIKQWALRHDVLSRFMLERSSGRLRTTHVYEDTIELLQEMADEDGVGQEFRATLDSQGYFPESLFYVLLGRPDRVVLHDPVAERMRNAGVKLK
jgi:hypothetical protein